MPDATHNPFYLWTLITVHFSNYISFSAIKLQLLLIQNSSQSFVMSNVDLEKPGAVDHVECTITEDSSDARITSSQRTNRRPLLGASIEGLSPPLGFCTVQVSWTEQILDLLPLQGQQTLFLLSGRLTILRLSRMNVDLNLIGPRYNIITLIFFIPYVLCQPPATVLIRKIGPRIFLSAITLFWGATMIVRRILEISYTMVSHSCSRVLASLQTGPL